MKYIIKHLSFSFLIILSLAACQPQKVITPETALDSYLKNDDKTFSWEIKDSQEAEGIKVYNLLVTSQKWREHTWRQQVSVIVPEKISYHGALLFINGGSNKNGMPNWKKADDGTTKAMAMIAQKNNSIVAIVPQEPNQPL